VRKEVAMGMEAETEEQKPLGLVWLNCPHPVVSSGLETALAGMGARIHHGKVLEGANPSLVVLCPSEEEDIAEMVGHFVSRAAGAPVVVLGLSADLRLARRVMRAGARGFLHAQMPPEQVAHALSVAVRGEVVLTNDLLRDLATEEEPRSDLNRLTSRQQEILRLLSEGLSNAEIARRLYLSESTVKQHLSGAYKVLKVKRRTQAAAIFRRVEFGQD
jgi:DNA-binding NarL/FixJ family response regulator